MKKICDLENWCFINSMSVGGDNWGLSGNVFGHPNFNNGEPIQIGKIIRFDKSKMEVETERTVFVLQTVSSHAFGGLQKQIEFIEAELS